MQVTLELPDDISATLLGHWPDLPKQALEALAVEGYRTAALTESQSPIRFSPRTFSLVCSR